MDRAEAQEIWGLFSALPSSHRSTAWPVCLPAHRESLAASCHLPCCSVEGCSQRRALGEQLWAPPQPQGVHSSSTACRAGGFGELLVTRTATDVLTLPFSVSDSPPPPNTNFLSILTYAWPCVSVQAMLLCLLVSDYCCFFKNLSHHCRFSAATLSLLMPSVFPALLPFSSSFPYSSSLSTFSVLVLTISSPPLSSLKLPLPNQYVQSVEPWRACTRMNMPVQDQCCW